MEHNFVNYNPETDVILETIGKHQKQFIVSRSDLEVIKLYKFRYFKPSNSQHLEYIYATIDNKKIYLHRFIKTPPSGYVVDHINGNGLDNRRENLRIVTHQQNMWNSKKTKYSTTKYRGVSRSQGKLNPFYVQIEKNGIPYYLGRFRDELTAAIAYDKKAKELFGEFAYLNFPDNKEVLSS